MRLAVIPKVLSLLAHFIQPVVDFEGQIGDI